MKKRWGSVKREVYQVLAATEIEGRLPDKFEAARLESRLHEFIATLSRQNDKSTGSAKTTEVASSSANDDAIDLTDFGAPEEENLEIGQSAFTEEMERGRKTKEPSIDSASKKKAKSFSAMQPVPAAVAPLADVSPPVVLVSVHRSQDIEKSIGVDSSSNDQMSVSTEPQFAPDSNTGSTPTSTNQVSSALDLSFDCDADREIWQTYLRYNDPDQPYTTKLPVLGAPAAVAALLCQRYNCSRRSLDVRLQKCWRVHQQSRACKAMKAGSVPQAYPTSIPVQQNVPASASPTGSGFNPNSEVDLLIWQTYLKYNDPDAPLSSGQPSFNAPWGALVQVREKCNLTKGRLLKRLTYIWYQYQQFRASASSVHTAVSNTAHATSVVLSPPTPFPQEVSPSPPPPAPPLPLSSAVLAGAMFSAQVNEELWQAFMKQRQYRKLPPRRLDNTIGENTLTVTFVTEHAKRLGCTYSVLRAHLKSMIVTRQTPKTTFSAKEDDYIWSTFQEHKQLDTVLKAEAARKLSETYQVKPEMVVERLQTLTAQRCVTPVDAEVTAPEPVQRTPLVATPGSAQRAHVPIPHSATTNVSPELPIKPVVSVPHGAAYSAETLAAQLDAATPPVSQPASRYATRSSVPSTSRALQEVNDQIWTAYSPYDRPGMQLNALPRTFLPDLANRLNMPSTAVKERLRGLILEHHPPPPPTPPTAAVGVARSHLVKGGMTRTSAPLVAKRKREHRANGEKKQKRQALAPITHPAAKLLPLDDPLGSMPVTPQEPMTGLMAALSEAALSLVAQQDEESGGSDDEEEDAPEGDMISILTASSDVSDIDEQDSKLHSVPSTRFTYTPVSKVPRAFVSASTDLRINTTDVLSPPQPICIADVVATVSLDRSLPSQHSPSPHSTADSAASDVSSVTTDAPFPLPFSAREDAYLWSMIQPSSSTNHLPIREMYRKVQDKLNRSFDEVRARMKELVQQRQREMET